ARPGAVAALGPEGPPVIAIVETAAGVRSAYETASSARVSALLLGAVDLGTEPGVEPRPDGLEILYARSLVVVDSAAAGIRPPFDIVHLDVRDEHGLEEECRFARSIGFRGKACIHPAQLEVVHRVFAPTEEELEWARRVVDAYERETGEGRGVFALNGAMVDLTVVEQARRILAEAERRERRCAASRRLRRRAGAAGSTRTSRSETPFAAGSAARSRRPTTSGSPA